MDKYRQWVNSVRDKSELLELQSLENNIDEIKDRFYRDLEFGTGGLRGIIGLGTNRMNVYTVGRATFGLGKYLLSQNNEPKVVIAYDSRKYSTEFARLSAEILSSQGIKAYLFDTLAPTPILSYAVRYLSANAGIVITASHNPKEYNGYKVYNEHGCQITDSAASEIMGAINTYGYFTEYFPVQENIVLIGEEIIASFLNKIKSYSLFDNVSSFAPSVVYTPLHGTGNIPVKRILQDLGVKELYVVKEQELPDHEFTTCPYPNPEEEAALTLALALAKDKEADIVLATDPDADRVGIAVKNGTNYVRLNGNETGYLLENYILERRQQLGLLPQSSAVVKTIVTGDMATSIAHSYNVEVKEVLTGFKYIGEMIDSLATPDDYMFGLEESYGYLIGTHARDKDAVSAVMMIVEMCAYYRSQGKTLLDKLKELYNTHGYYQTALTTQTYKGADGVETMKKIVQTLRDKPIKTLCGEPVISMTDYMGNNTGLPKSNVLMFKSKNYKVVVRPSGTEPKLKTYFQVKSESNETTCNLLKNLVDCVEEILAGGQG
jgi:phosphoglucomutase